MNDKEKKKYLEDKGLKSGNEVYFEVENPSLWIGGITGILKLDKDFPYIILESGKHITINKGYDAYIGTIRKLT